MEEEFVIQAIVAAVLLLFAVWFFNPFSAYDMRANPLNFLLLFSCSFLSLVLMEFGERELKVKLTYESFSLLAGMIVLSALLAYGLMGYGSVLSTPYPLLTSAFFLLPILQLFIKERF
jgi:quinol-cytochrome oxidoreductase complex cytochrome b subunit